MLGHKESVQPAWVTYLGVELLFFDNLMEAETAVNSIKCEPPI